MENLKVIDQGLSVLHPILNALRDVEIQKDRQRFRDNMRMCGRLLAYELSRHLVYQDRQIQTPLAQIGVKEIEEELVLANVLRASGPLFEGVLELFPQADTAFVSARRMRDREGELYVEQTYVARPEIGNRSLLLIDPMLATGQSLIAAYHALTNENPAAKTYVLSLFASPEGVEAITKEIAPNLIITGTLDKELNQQSYIVPGLGDAGDLAYGPKLR